MLLECLIKREGSTFITLDKFNYEFKARPELEQTQGDTANVCFVNSADHSARLISTGMYREYKRKAAPSVASQEPPAEKITKESFTSINNAPKLKGLIHKCSDAALLRELLEEEAAAATPREWFGEALSKKIDALEGGK